MTSTAEGTLPGKPDAVPPQSGDDDTDLVDALVWDPAERDKFVQDARFEGHLARSAAKFKATMGEEQQLIDEIAKKYEGKSVAVSAREMAAIELELRREQLAKAGSVCDPDRQDKIHLISFGAHRQPTVAAPQEKQ